MSMPIKISDALVLDARTAGTAMAGSMSSHVEFWARLGRALEPLLTGTQAMRLSRMHGTESLADAIAQVDSPAGRERLAVHLASQPFPHYTPHPERPGLLIRTDADGTRTTGRFIRRVFTVDG